MKKNGRTVGGLLEAWMKSKLKLVFLTASLMISDYGYGQQQYSANQIVTEYQTVVPSPNVSGLLKAVNTPVNGYSGTAHVSIDIFTIPGKGFQIPISLSYSTSGFNVNEIPTWVGAGWSLSGTGVVGRSIRDLPDESGFSYYGSQNNAYFRADGTPKIDSLLATMGNGIGDPSAKFLLLYQAAYNATPGNPTFLQGANFDTEPDKYSYTLPTGISGGFVFNRQKQIVKTSETPMDITYNDLSSQPFTLLLRDGQGNRYTFSQENFETVNPQSICAGSFGLVSFQPTVSAWHLSSIISGVSSDSALYTYVSETVQYPTSTSYTKVVKLASEGSSTNIQEPQDRDCYLNQTSTTRRISQISYNDYVIKFEADPAVRLDLTGGHRLKRIVVLHKGDTIKRFDFYHSYFKTDQFLRLDSIVEHSDNQVLPPYKFIYDDDLASPFPDRNSYDQDYWGFFNNAGNTVSYPETWIYEYPIDESILPGLVVHRYQPGANRDPNIAFATKGALTSVVFPTGGRTDFTYELNSYRNFSPEYKSQRQKKTFAGGAGSTHLSIVGTRYPQAGETPKNYIAVTDLVTCAIPGGGIPFGCGTVTIKTSTGQPVYTFVEGNNLLLPIEPGNYIVETGSNPQYGNSGITIEWFNYDVNTLLKEKQGGGLRVKEIARFTEGNTLASKEAWEYQGSDSISSGSLFTPIIPYKTQLYVSGYMVPVQGCQEDGLFRGEYAMVSSNLEYTMQRVLGGYVGYSRVIEKVVANNTQSQVSVGAKVKEFLNGGITNNIFPAGPPVADVSGINGKVTKEQVFDEANRLLYEKKISYTYSSFPKVWGFRLESLSISGCQNLIFQPAYYYETNDFAKVDSVRETSFSNNEAQSKWQKSQYVSFQGTYLPSKTISSRTNGGVLEQRFTENFYPFQLGSGYSAMLSNNFVTQPVFEISGSGNFILSGIQREYSFAGAATLLSKVNLLPSKKTPLSQLTSLLSNPQTYFENVLELNYDSHQRKIRQKQNSGRLTSFVWGDSDEIPVAVVEHAEPSDIYYNGLELGAGAIDPAEGKRCHVLSGTYATGFAPSTTGNYWLSYYYRTSVNSPWELRTILVNYPSASFTIPETTGFIDAIRIHPVGSMMESYFYQPGVGVQSMEDKNRKFSRYEYDAFGRLEYIKDDQKNILKRSEYFYRAQE